MTFERLRELVIKFEKIALILAIALPLFSASLIAGRQIKRANGGPSTSVASSVLAPEASPPTETLASQSTPTPAPESAKPAEVSSTPAAKTEPKTKIVEPSTSAPAENPDTTLTPTPALDSTIAPTPTPTKKTYPAVKTTLFGVSLSPFPYYQETQAALEESVRLAAELGVNIIRLDYPVNWSYLEPWYSKFVEAIKSRSIEVVMSFQPPQTYETANPWQAGFDLGKKIAEQFGGQVIYQIGNEICGNAVKPGWPGTTKESFYEDKLEKVRAWVKGASTAVAQYAPGAQQATTGHWLHYWCANEILNGDGGIPNIKILGWDWFNDRNQDLTAVKNGDEVVNLVEKLQEIDRELWLMESGNERGGYAGEELQADYLERFANHSVGTKAFKAFFSFYLHDDANKILSNPADGSRGLIRININEHGHYSLGGLKPAYDRYKQVITKYK